MSTPTPIETVRAHLAWMAECFATVGMSTNDDPLYAALADAERFKALERAHKKEELIYVMVPDPHDDDLWAPHDGTLAELADRLREGAR